MPALDYCHPHIVHALEKDGWAVDVQPRQFYVEGRNVFIDIHASRGVNGDRQQILLAEIKCFPNRFSTTRELYIAIGQYIVYRAVLNELQDHTTLYLAIPEAVYRNVFDSTVMRAIKESNIKLVIVNLEQEQIVQWNE